MTSITDYFLIASGRNAISVRSLSEDLEDKLAEEGVLPRRREGVRESRWIVLDYANVIVHIFHPEERALSLIHIYITAPYFVATVSAESPGWPNTPVTVPDSVA